MIIMIIITIIKLIIIIIIITEEAMAWKTEGSWFCSWQRQESLLLFKLSTLFLESIQRPTWRVLGSLFFGISRLSREANHSHSPSSEVKNGTRHTSTPTHTCIVCTGTTLIYLNIIFCIYFSVKYY